ncbi:MAG: hypothetical protein HYZ11_01935 [Candidatus Tectomicrobia bacterium]|uniref:Uncharacterized protein n=1 Tax=Tectimicrobiota bacterium TaxID=2528274 RepID=A0A932HXQ8_UNCTE|nr:hypothetical protein [Candidatus Tectomicrobia bacterium]
MARRGGFKLRWGGWMIALAALGLPAEGLVGGYFRLEPRWLDAEVADRCRGDFLVFEEYQAEPHQPFMAVVSGRGYRPGAMEWNLQVRVEEGKSLPAYIRQLGTSLGNYAMISQETGGEFLCGLQHHVMRVFVDVETKRVDVHGNTAKVSGGGAGGE